MLVQNYEILEDGTDLNNITTPGVYICNYHWERLQNTPCTVRSGEVENELFGYSFILRVYELRQPGYENGRHLSQEVELCGRPIKFYRLYVENPTVGNIVKWSRWVPLKPDQERGFVFNSSDANSQNITKYTLNFDTLVESGYIDCVGVDEIIGNPAPNAYKPPCAINGFLLCISSEKKKKIETNYPETSLQIWFPSGLAANSYINGNVIKYRTRWYDGSRYTYGGQTSGKSYSDWKELIPVT